jgi:sulfite reductase (NADPH) flavoprotein alpha-component
MRPRARRVAMTIRALIPESAPFERNDIDALNRIFGEANAAQRAWLAGFLADIDAVSQNPVASLAETAQPLTIVYASESGNAEGLAGNVAKAARKHGLKSTVIDMAELDVASLPDVRNLIVVAATWGEGEPPSRAARVYDQLMSEAAPRIDRVKYGVLALGDSAYAHFCATGRAIDERLEALGATRAIERIDCDLDFAVQAAQWIGSALDRLRPIATNERRRVTPVDFGPRVTTTADIIEAEVTEHINLNSSRSAKETIHLELAFDEVPPYKPGDSLDLYPQNDPDYVDALLQAARLSNGDLRQELIAERDVTTLSLKTLEKYAAILGRGDVTGQAVTWITGRQLIDLLEAFPTSLTAEQLRELTRPLAPRAYSIASSRQAVGNEAHLLVAAVRYESHGRRRTGVASTFVADRLKKGHRIRVKLRPNRHFALPDPDRDIIMVGPGTGVAPFRAFVQERHASGASGRNWLFFGDRTFTHDFLYQLEWQNALRDGALVRIDLAFSRDTAKKIYVQHRIWDRRRDIVDWLENGANFYVCGDAKAMAKDVRHSLVRAYADVKAVTIEAADEAVAALEYGRRYQQDVY